MSDESRVTEGMIDRAIAASDEWIEKCTQEGRPLSVRDDARVMIDAALGLTGKPDYRELTGCEHGLYEGCAKCICAECGTRVARITLQESGCRVTMPVTIIPCVAGPRGLMVWKTL